MLVSVSFMYVVCWYQLVLCMLYAGISLFYVCCMLVSVSFMYVVCWYQLVLCMLYAGII